MKLRLYDLPEDRIYVIVSEEFNERLMSKIKSKFKTFTKFYTVFGLNHATFNKWKKARQYPLILIKRMCRKTDISFNDLERNTNGIRSGRFFSKGKFKSTVIYPKFPIKLSSELVRMIAHMLGDGCITISKRGHYNFQYYNKNKFLIKMFKEDARKVFGNLHIHESNNKGTPYIFLPSPVTIIFLQLVKDFHSNTSRIPNFIRNSSLALKREFLRCIFDDEAHVEFRKNQRRIEFALSNEIMINDVKNLLKDFNIKLSKTYKRTDMNGKQKIYFYIRNFVNINKFFKEIGFYHPRKKEKLEKIIKNPGRKSYARGETEKLIINLLQNEMLTVYEISKRLERSYINTSAFVRSLSKEGRIDSIRLGKQKLWKVRI